jgi:hypothetical protein
MSDDQYSVSQPSTLQGLDTGIRWQGGVRVQPEGVGTCGGVVNLRKFLCHGAEMGGLTVGRSVVEFLVHCI